MDTTTQAVAPVHVNNPKGLGLFRDEISGFIKDFNRFSANGGDREFWTESYNGNQYTVDRKPMRTTTQFRIARFPSLAAFSPKIEFAHSGWRWRWLLREVPIYLAWTRGTCRPNWYYWRREAVKSIWNPATPRDADWRQWWLCSQKCPSLPVQSMNYGYFVKKWGRRQVSSRQTRKHFKQAVYWAMYWEKWPVRRCGFLLSLNIYGPSEGMPKAGMLANFVNQRRFHKKPCSRHATHRFLFHSNGAARVEWRTCPQSSTQRRDYRKAYQRNAFWFNDTESRKCETQKTGLEDCLKTANR